MAALSPHQRDLLLWPDADPLALSLVDAVFAEARQFAPDAAPCARFWLDQPWPRPDPHHQLWLIGGSELTDHPPLQAWLHDVLATGEPIIAIGSAIPWLEKNLAALLPAPGDAFRTSAGGLGVVPLLFDELALHHGHEVAHAVAHALHLPALQDAAVLTQRPLPAKVEAALALMNANVEEPLTSDEIASHVGVSRRQLERLFKQCLQQVPSQYYLELRLNQARQLLRTTHGSIIQIGLSCGFSSGSHFASAYRAVFGLTPREERARQSR